MLFRSIEGDNSQPVLTHKRQDWAERYPHWREIELVPKLVQEPVIDKSAAVRIATALGWEPKREWKTLTDAQYQDILKQTEGCGHLAFYHLIEQALREANHMAQNAEREKVANWMMRQGYATGHGDTVEDLLKELEWQAKERGQA